MPGMRVSLAWLCPTVQWQARVRRPGSSENLAQLGGALVWRVQRSGHLHRHRVAAKLKMNVIRPADNATSLAPLYFPVAQPEMRFSAVFQSDRWMCAGRTVSESAPLARPQPGVAILERRFHLVTSYKLFGAEFLRLDV